MDMNMQKVTVMGWVDQEKILKTIRKTGRKADLWPYTPQGQHNGVVRDFYQHYYHSHHHDDTDVIGHIPAFTAYDAPISPSVMSHNYLTTNHHYDGGGDDDNDDDHNYFGSYNQQNLAPYSTLVDDKTSVLFSDENPHACSIM